MGGHVFTMPTTSRVSSPHKPRPARSSGVPLYKRQSADFRHLADEGRIQVDYGLGRGKVLKYHWCSRLMIRSAFSNVSGLLPGTGIKNVRDAHAGSRTLAAMQPCRHSIYPSSLALAARSRSCFLFY